MRIAVCTTFPDSYWQDCASKMIASWSLFWPNNTELFVATEGIALAENIMACLSSNHSVHISAQRQKDHQDFIDRNAGKKPESYLFDAVRFSHKIYSIKNCYESIKDSFDYLIWLDADTETIAPINDDYIKSTLPKDPELVSYLGRSNAKYSECGFVAYRVCQETEQAINAMVDFYNTDNVYSLSGYTDCHVFDEVFKNSPKKNLSEGIPGLNVWPMTVLGERLVHNKGNRKLSETVLEKPVQASDNQSQQQPKKVVDANNLQIKTRNCIQNDDIKNNVSINKGFIRNWVSMTKPSHKGVVICSAGPSLETYINDVRKKQEEGYYVVSVKHALDVLKKHKITPDACVLLDPRQHVEGFVKNPDPDVLYFVASMCDPAVVKSLLANRCSIIGYHAFVAAGETDVLNPDDLLVCGGSATATRSLMMFADTFGYKDFELYGYDLCYHEKPDLNIKGEDGYSKFMEVPMAVDSYGKDKAVRTFWTEGQLLAQAQELSNLIKNRNDLNIVVHGDGIAGWMWRHSILNKKWSEEIMADLTKKREDALNFMDMIKNAGFRRNKLS
jgi:hypothetical protein